MDYSLDDFTLWMEGLSKGDSEAAELLWKKYFQKLVRYAARRLRSMPKRVADEEDVALSAMQSFCHGIQAGKFENLKDRDDLWKLLLTITARKAYRQIGRQMTQKRGGGHVRGDSGFEGAPGDVERTGIASILSDEPTPELAAMFAENCQTLLDKLDDPLLRRIAVLRLEGYSNVEIARECDRAIRTVERKLERIRAIWKPINDDPADQMLGPTP